MTWQRSLVAHAMADQLKAAQGVDDTASIFSSPPETLNAPAIVVGRPTEVQYSTPTFGRDTATLPVVCLGPSTGDDIVDALITFVRGAITADPTLGGVVPLIDDIAERNWRAVRVGGVDLLAADVSFTIQM